MVTSSFVMFIILLCFFSLLLYISTISNINVMAMFDIRTTHLRFHCHTVARLSSHPVQYGHSGNGSIHVYHTGHRIVGMTEIVTLFHVMDNTLKVFDLVR